MIINIFLFIFEAIFALVLIKIFLFNEKYQRFFTSTFLLLFSILFIFVPLVLFCFLDNLTRVNSYLDQMYFSYESLFTAHFYTIFILSLFFLYSKIKFSTSETELISIKHYQNYVVAFYVSAAIAIAGIFFLFYGFGTLDVRSIWVAGRFGSIANSYSSIVISQYLISASMLTIGLFYFINFSYMRVILLTIVIGTLLFYSLITFDRKFIFYIASGILGGYFLKHRLIYIKKRWVFYAFIGVFLLSISQIIRDFLGSFLASNDLDFNLYFSNFLNDLIFFMEYGDISYFYRASIESVELTRNGAIEIGAVFWRNILFFIPSSLSFGIKPPDVSLIFAEAIGASGGGRIGNQPPGFYGLFLVSFGQILSILPISLFLLVCAFFDRLSQKRWINAPMAICGLFTALFLLRGDDSSAIYFLVFNYIIFLMSYIICVFFNHKSA